MKSKDTIIFLRHSKLLLPYKDHGEMPVPVLAELGLQKINPPIDGLFTARRLDELASAISLPDIKSVYTSRSRRCRDTAAAIHARTTRGVKNPAKGCVVFPSLREIYFDLQKLYSAFGVQAAMKGKGITGVNSIVFRGMVSGSCCDPIAKVYKRVNELFKEIKNLGDGKCVFVTHDFFMRVVEIYIKRHGVSYATITENDLEHTQRNTYLTGFSTNAELASFQSVG